jgi:hypothetical protein
MSIHQQVADATFLAQKGCHEGALTNLMLAVAASARKCFPKGTKSLEKPAEPMGDREAFTLFLGGRIRKLLFGDYGGPEYGTSGISVDFKGHQYDIAYVLYKFYRCELVHEGELPEDVEFIARPGSASPSANTGNSGLSVSISSGNKMVLDHGWIDLLIAAVIHARCNGAEFGIQHSDLVAKANIDATAFEQATVAKYEITPGRFHILKHAVRLISPGAVDASDDVQLSGRFAELVHSGQINGGAVNGLRSRGLTDQAGRLQPKGIAVLREIASAHVLVPA